MEGVSAASRSSSSYHGRYHRLPRTVDQDYDVEEQVFCSGLHSIIKLAVRRGKTRAGKIERFAVKIFDLSMMSEKERRSLHSEVEIFLSLDHMHVARLVDVYQSPEALHLVMECLEGGGLFDHVAARAQLPEESVADATWQMLLALNYLHSHDIVHRDIKLEHFLYDAVDSNCLKLIDFGMSKRWSALSDEPMAMSCGTLPYMAPEVLKSEYTSQCDLWALGVIVFALLSGTMPFDGESGDVMVAILTGRYAVNRELWQHISPLARDFTKKLLMVDSNQRLTAPQALEHPFISERLHKRHTSARVDAGVLAAIHTYCCLSKFRRSCMLVLAWSLPSGERAKLDSLFLDIDCEGCGCISMSGLRKYLMDDIDIPSSEVVRAIDAMRLLNGEIGYSDFLAAMMILLVSPPERSLRATFNRFDVDGVGFITPVHLQTVLGIDFDESELASPISRGVQHDTKIRYPEFAAYFQQSCAAAAPPRQHLDNHEPWQLRGPAMDREIDQYVDLGNLEPWQLCSEDPYLNEMRMLDVESQLLAACHVP